MLDGLKKVLCTGSENENKSDVEIALESITTITQEESDKNTNKQYQTKNFKKLLIEDMQSWVHQAFINIKL